MRKLIAKGYDALHRFYEVFDYGERGWTATTINGLPHDGLKCRYVCFCDGRVFTCGNSRENVVSDVREVTENSRYYGERGSFTLCD